MKYNLRLLPLLLFIVFSHLSGCRSSSPTAAKNDVMHPMLTGYARVYDGDSIFFGSVEVRLDGIDAPERDQACLDVSGKFWPCGIAARDALRGLIAGGQVQCVIKGKDKYRRLLGFCRAGAQDLNAVMVEQGNAVAYHYFSERYAKEELRAKARHLGIWQDASFTEPFYCRHFTAGHTCYEYDYAGATGKIAPLPLIGKSHAAHVPD